MFAQHVALKSVFGSVAALAQVAWEPACVLRGAFVLRMCFLYYRTFCLPNLFIFRLQSDGWVIKILSDIMILFHCVDSAYTCSYKWVNVEYMYMYASCMPVFVHYSPH